MIPAVCPHSLSLERVMVRLMNEGEFPILILNLTFGLVRYTSNQRGIKKKKLGHCGYFLVLFVTAGGSAAAVWGRLTSVAGWTMRQSITEKCVMGRCSRSRHQLFVLTCEE